MLIWTDLNANCCLCWIGETKAKSRSAQQMIAAGTERAHNSIRKSVLVAVLAVWDRTSDKMIFICKSTIFHFIRILKDCNFLYLILCDWLNLLKNMNIQTIFWLLLQNGVNIFSWDKSCRVLIKINFSHITTWKSLGKNLEPSTVQFCVIKAFWIPTNSWQK